MFAGSRFGEPIFEWPVLPDVPAAKQCYVRDFAKSVPGYKIGMLYAGSGFGIHREVFLETMGTACVREVFVRGDPPGRSEGRRGNRLRCRQATCPGGPDPAENFAGPSFAAAATHQVPPGAGKLAVTVAMPGARLWQPADPCLYRCRVVVRDGDRLGMMSEQDRVAADLLAGDKPPHRLFSPWSR